MKSQILIYAGGSSLGNPGPGGWGAVVVYHGDKLKIKSVKLKVERVGRGRETHDQQQNGIDRGD